MADKPMTEADKKKEESLKKAVTDARATLRTAQKDLKTFRDSFKEKPTPKISIPKDIELAELVKAQKRITNRIEDLSKAGKTIPTNK